MLSCCAHHQLNAVCRHVPCMRRELFKDGYGTDGNRVYDKVNGMTCHQCRQKTLGRHTSCSECQTLHVSTPKRPSNCPNKTWPVRSFTMTWGHKPLMRLIYSRTGSASTRPVANLCSMLRRPRPFAHQCTIL